MRVSDPTCIKKREPREGPTVEPRWPGIETPACGLRQTCHWPEHHFSAAEAARSPCVFPHSLMTPGIPISILFNRSAVCLPTELSLESISGSNPAKRHPFNSLAMDVRASAGCTCSIHDILCPIQRGFLRFAGWDALAPNLVNDPRPNGGALDRGLQRRPVPNSQSRLSASRCPGLFILG